MVFEAHLSSTVKPTLRSLAVTSQKALPHPLVGSPDMSPGLCIDGSNGQSSTALQLLHLFRSACRVAKWLIAFKFASWLIGLPCSTMVDKSLK